MTDELLNNQLYDSLCASVLKWFETDRGYDVEITINRTECGKDISYPDAVIGDTIRNAHFCVAILKEPIIEGEPFRCWFGISIEFRDEIHAIGEKENEDRGYMLNVINQFNMWNNGKLCCFYDERFDRIKIHQDFYFYPGSHPTDNEIAKTLDEFYFNKDIEGIAELIESGGWRFPDLHVKDLFVRKIDLS